MRVIVPAHDATETLSTCLESLLKSSIPFDFEVVVVDDGGNNNLNQLVIAYPVKIIQGPRAGSAGLARNWGATADEDVLVFVDADVEVESKTIEYLVAPIYNGLADATVGNYSQQIDGMNFAQSYKQLYISTIYARRQGLIANQFWTALGAIKASVFAELGGFDAEISGAAGEDTELGLRLTHRGKRVFAVPQAQGRHLKQFTPFSLISNDFRKGMRDFYLTLHHSHLMKDHRHTSVSDILAVILAYAMGGWFLLAPSVFKLSLMGAVLGSCLMAGAYLMSRMELLAVYWAPGTTFFVKAMGMMWCLDLVRGVCVGLGCLKFLLSKVKRSNLLER